jgi:hypothetical protein
MNTAMRLEPRRPAHAPVHLQVTAALGAAPLVLVVLTLVTPWQVSLLAGWDAMALVYGGWLLFEQDQDRLCLCSSDRALGPWLGLAGRPWALLGGLSRSRGSAVGLVGVGGRCGDSTVAGSWR